jgi:quercetin dioxygenase-like cupin family protein
MSLKSDGFIVASHEGPTWEMEAGRPTIFKLLSHQCGGSIAIFEEVVPPGMGTPLHIHRTANEVIYIVSGEFAIRLGDITQIAYAGSWIFIPLGSTHGWRNCGSNDGRAFFVFAPGAGAAAFEEMRLQGMPLPDIDPKVRTEVFERNGYEFITWDWE